MFPRHADGEDGGTEARLEQASALLDICLRQVDAPDPASAAEALLLELPEVRRQLGTDLEAAYRGDPAAASPDEILLCYPAFQAIATYRLAHILYRQRVPLLPRIMSEYAHRRTGIDIHPGAVIGDYFFIDHGTGVVIGETSTIGRDVKLYQHVTIGAKSFEVGPDGSLVKGIKRHPDIGDRVVIYAGATILGGDTRIGDDCTIGGSVWLTHSVPAGTLVLARPAVTTAQNNLPGNP
ncbi:MAG: serine acetyltransferase [Oscillospiraceae bacterium]|nr:serine acetyltransferase [Oscillospiraceae bacterium]